MEKENDYIYRLEEMKDEMNKSIENLKEVLKQDLHLIEVLNSIKDDKSISDLVTTLKEQHKSYESQLSVMTTKVNNLIVVINNCKADEKIKEQINNLIIALGIFYNK